RGDRPAFPGEELVMVAAPMFPHRTAKGYSNPFLKVVKEVNGVRVKNLRHLVELLRDSDERFTTIAFHEKGAETLVFDHKEALAATEEVLNDNGIRQRASDDLMALEAIDRILKLKVKHALDLYQAENGRYPKGDEEFMTEVIKANGIALPQL